MSDLLVVTDLDGCLLDERCGHGPAREALEALAEAAVPVVLASSQTQDEVVALRRELGLEAPFIVENGGALLFPTDPHLTAVRARGGLFALELGVRRFELLRALREIADEAGARLVGFAELGSEGIAALTGLDPVAARRAAAREFDEPFLCEDHDPAVVRRVEEGAARRGLLVSHGGRFLHLSGPADKGTALRALLRHEQAHGRRYATVGLGDAPNDVGLLRTVDRPVVVPRSDGRPEPRLARALPGAELAPAPGPRGWNAAVLAVLAGVHLEPIGA